MLLGTLRALTTNFIMSNAPDDFPNNNNNLCAYSQTRAVPGSFTVSEEGTYQSWWPERSKATPL